MLKNILIVNLTGCRLTPAWIVANLEIGNFVPGFVNIGNEVAFGNLLMV